MSESNGMKCHNCHGVGHRASNCPFSPNHRRCYTCGRAGGKFQHRVGCEDTWYNLSILPPRNENGELYPRDTALNMLWVQYKKEKNCMLELRRREIHNLSNNMQDRQQPKRIRVTQPQQTVVRPFDRESHTDGVGNLRPITKRTVVWEVPKAKDANKAMSSISNSPIGSIGGMVQDVRVTDGIMTPDGKPINKRTETATVDYSQRSEIEKPSVTVVSKKETVKEVRVADGVTSSQGKQMPQKADDIPVLLADCEKTYYLRSDVGFGIRLNEVDAHPLAEAPPLLLRFVFRQTPKIFIDSGTSNEIELSSTMLRMRNGLRVSYNGMFLDICGRPRGEVVLLVGSTNFSFRLAINETCVGIDESYFLSEFGMACLTMTPSTLPPPPSATVTIVGPLQESLRIRYKENRYEMTFADGIARVNPYIQRKI